MAVIPISSGNTGFPAYERWRSVVKKKVKIVIIILLIVVLAVCAWFIGYHTRKSQDNLPSLESIAEMDEADINDLFTLILIANSV